MNESQGALAPATSELMKLPSLDGSGTGTDADLRVADRVLVEPAGTNTGGGVLVSVDMLVLKLNEIVRPSPSASCDVAIEHLVHLRAVAGEAVVGAVHRHRANAVEPVVALVLEQRRR